MEKHLRCNMKISKGPLLIRAISLPPPRYPPTWDPAAQNEDRRGRHVSSLKSVRQLHGHTLHQLHRTSHSSTRFPTQTFFGGMGGGAKGVWLMVFKTNKPLQIKRRSTSQGIWWLRKVSCCPLRESDSLITVERMNLKGAGEKFSTCLQLVVIVVYIEIYIWWIYKYIFFFILNALFVYFFFLAIV